MGGEEQGTMRDERCEMSRGGEAIGFVIVGRIGCGAVAATMQRDATRRATRARDARATPL